MIDENADYLMMNEKVNGPLYNVPAFITRTSRKGIVSSDSISIVNWMAGHRLLWRVRKFCIPYAT
jgi:hypothetical protein